MGTRRLRLASSHWLLLLMAVAPTALVGCRTGQRAQTSAPANTPTEKVAGSRQEDETTRILREANLPETFAFGGRTWRAHQVHWVDLPAGSGSVPTTSGTDGAAGTTGTMPEETRPSTKGGTTGGTTSVTPAGALADFIPVANLQVLGHQIYRQTGVDEALTDNIFLKVENVSAAGAGASSNAPATGTGAGTTGTAGTASTNRVAFIEYEASGETMANMELPQVLSMAGLPQTVTMNGKTFTAKELQVYDADVFGKLKPLAQKVGGHYAYQGDDKNTLYLMSEKAVGPSGGAAASNVPGTTGTPSGTESASEGGTTGAGGTTTTETSAEMQGPIFVRYEMVGGMASGGKTK